MKNILKFQKTQKRNVNKKIRKKFSRKTLDFIEILVRLKELQMLKLIFLNEDQLILFQFLTKPIISLENNKKYESKS